MAAGNTYVAIATNTLGSNTNTVSFTSIPGTYTDLIFVFEGTMASGTDMMVQFNSDTGTNYSSTRLYGNGTSALSTRQTSDTAFYPAIGSLANRQNIIFQVMNYSNTTTYKTALDRANNPAANVGAHANLWRSTAAITRIDIIGASSGTFATGSTFNLYGIAAA
jgi:hypothetical protein